jgi:hypothetical protein
MTDTPDALYTLQVNYGRHGPSADYTDTGRTLADLTAGDAAIKRVAELETQKGDGWTTVDFVRAALVAIIGDGYNERSVLPAVGRVERIVASLKADLAAARAEIECKDAVLTKISTASIGLSPTATCKNMREIARAALAPKETDNG